MAGAGRHSWSVSQLAPAAGEVPTPAPASSSSPHPPQHQPPAAPLCLKAPKFKRAWRGSSSLPAALELPHASLPAGDAHTVLEQGALLECRRVRKLKSCKGSAEPQPVPAQPRRQWLQDVERMGRGWGTGPTAPQPQLALQPRTCLTVPCLTVPRLAMPRDSSFLPPNAELKPHLGLKKTNFPHFPLRQWRDRLPGKRRAERGSAPVLPACPLSNRGLLSLGVV